jgi:hypothetical protein
MIETIIVVLFITSAIKLNKRTYMKTKIKENYCDKWFKDIKLDSDMVEILKEMKKL